MCEGMTRLRGTSWVMVTSSDGRLPSSASMASSRNLKTSRRPTLSVQESTRGPEDHPTRRPGQGAPRGADGRWRLLRGERARRLRPLDRHLQDPRRPGTLCRLYRVGMILNSEQRRSFELLISGLVLRGGQDRKVIRWCLNALAFVGTRGGADKYISPALRLYDGDPEITAAGIAALSKMHGERIGEHAEFVQFDPTLRTLAAMQHTPAISLDTSKIKINIDNSGADILKLALITVGLNREIENLFHPRHSNGQVVRALGQHSDPIVVQYSVWAIIENERLSMTDLGVSLDHVEDLPPNVQSKVLQLILEREPDFELKHRHIADTPYNPCREAREGLARGLCGNYYDGLEEVTIDWFDQEQEDDIRGCLAEHFARYSDECGPYEDKVLRIIESDARLKSRIIMGAEGKPLFRTIRERDAIEALPDLFGGGVGQLEARILKLESGAKAKAIEMKVVLLAASPVDEGRLRLDQEARDLKEKMKLVDRPTVTVMVSHEWAVRVDQLQDILLNQRPEVLQFSGHGGSGEICFEDYSGKAAPVSGKDFAELIKLGGSSVRCVILNACYSTDIIAEISAPVQCVIGCEESIGDDAAIVFSKAFYRALAHGKGFEGSFRLAKNAVSMECSSREADKYSIKIL